MSKRAITASHEDNETNRAWDGDTTSRWTSGTPQSPGMWFQFDMRKPRTLTRVTLDSLASKNDGPRTYEAWVSDDGEKWSEPVVTGKSAAMTNIDFPPQTVARFVRITQIGSDKGCFWSFHELAVYGAAEDKRGARCSADPEGFALKSDISNSPLALAEAGESDFSDPTRYTLLDRGVKVLKSYEMSPESGILSPR